jgi:hypothetical protein
VAPELSSIKVSCLINSIRKVDEAVLFRTSCLKERGLEICHSDASSDSDDGDNGNRLASSLLMRNVNAMNRVVKTLRNVQNDLQQRVGRDRLTSHHLRSERGNGMNGIDPNYLQCSELYIYHEGKGGVWLGLHSAPCEQVSGEMNLVASGSACY